MNLSGMRILARAAVIAASMALLSCGGSGGNGDPDPPPPPPPPPLSGLDARPSNTSCLAGQAPTGEATLAVQRVFAGVGTFSSPILMLQEPASAARWYVVEQTGRVQVFDNQADATQRRQFVDATSLIAGASGGEMGLLGMTFHPGWPADPRVYLSYTAVSNGQRVSRISEFTSSDGGQTISPATARVILQTYQPDTNHNGGNIAFGPDGFLYIGLGDGGGSGDNWGTIGNGQRLSTLLGKMLRIDVAGTTGATPYAIPVGNPYSGNAVCNNDTGAFTQQCPEIYAYGLRNPWRWSFDRDTGELWLGDVGQGAWEEINRIEAGGNYGWRCREGAHGYNGNCGPNAGSAIDPVAEFPRQPGNAVTGGYVYRGSAIAQLAGRYVFGDYGSGRIWHIARDTTPTLQVTNPFNSNLNISSFAQDADGEIYAVHLGGTLHRLTASTGPGTGGPPSLLSASGCVNATDPARPAAGLIPYAPNAPFWSDSAVKQRFMALPDGQNINVAVDGDFVFPAGSVLVKHFRLGARLVETRLLMRHDDGSWAGYTYEWNEQGSEATRVVGGKSVAVAGQSWRFPSETQCLFCHSEAAGRSLGLELAQLNGTLAYAATGRTANQLATLDALDMLVPALDRPPEELPAMPDPFGSVGSLNERARAYLHTNCSHCHRPGGPTPVDMDLRYTTPLGETRACDVVPVRDLGMAGVRRIAITGTDRASLSLLVVRPSRTDGDAMPPIQPRVVDAAGVALLTEWVNSLGSCD